MKTIEIDTNELLKQFGELEKKEFVGEAGAGMVKVTMGVDMIITKVEIDHTVFNKTGPEIIKDSSFMADLFKAAANQAIKKVNEDIITHLDEEVLQRVSK